MNKEKKTRHRLWKELNSLIEMYYIDRCHNMDINPLCCHECDYLYRDEKKGYCYCRANILDSIIFYTIKEDKNDKVPRI